jgi:GT2 family glycosyltransferase
MITVIYSTHKDKTYNENFRNHLKKSVGLKDVQILEYQNNNEFSLAQIYNKGIGESIYNIVVACHNDIKLEDGWGKKLLNDFESNPDFGIIGKAGSCYFPESGVYWERMNQTMVGQVYHQPEGQKKWLSKYSAKLPFLIPVVTVDGLFIAFDKTKIKHMFDETIGRFHFYDHGFSVPNYLDGVKIGVTSSFEITHQSIGQPNQEFFDSKDKFLQKWGSKLPLDLKPEKVFYSEIKEKPLKNIGKVAVIIPTKGKVDMLFECVNSFFEKCNPQYFSIFIADTGSSEDEKKFIREKILTLGDVRLIEYDYYNFAKINNDVVKNHVGDEYEFLLFCNNDIKLLNNVISGMINIYKTKDRVGTVGVRLHYDDNTLQHDGIFIYMDTKKRGINVAHRNSKSYYNFSTGINEVFGGTAGLLMIKKILFEKINGFNEKYRYCFEDVELNLQLKLLNYNNYVNSDCVSYHYESQTREIESKEKEMIEDYNTNLFPLIRDNFEKIKKYILMY